MSDHGHGAPAPTIYGILAEFPDADSLVAAANRVREAGYRRADAYAPFPVHGLAEALRSRRTRVPMLTLAGGLFGACGGFFMLWYANTQCYIINVGGRPLNSWPAFIPITFEMGVLFAALSTVVGLIALNGLPMPYHPLFNVPSFTGASKDRFFLCIESADRKFDLLKTRQFLTDLHPLEVVEVPR
jgi:Protein of unknown function (DUF3341)